MQYSINTLKSILLIFVSTFTFYLFTANKQLTVDILVIATIALLLTILKLFVEYRFEAEKRRVRRYRR